MAEKNRRTKPKEDDDEDKEEGPLEKFSADEIRALAKEFVDKEKKVIQEVKTLEFEREVITKEMKRKGIMKPKKGKGPISDIQHAVDTAFLEETGIQKPDEPKLMPKKKSRKPEVFKNPFFKALVMSMVELVFITIIGLLVNLLVATYVEDTVMAIGVYASVAVLIVMAYFTLFNYNFSVVSLADNEDDEND